jgi:hypothetical protein
MTTYAGSHRLEDAVRHNPLPLSQLAIRARIADHRVRLAAWTELHHDGLHDLHRGRSFIGAGRDQWARDRMLKAVGARRGARHRPGPRGRRVSAKAWRSRRGKPPRVEVVIREHSTCLPVEFRRVKRVDAARTRRAEQLARRRARHRRQEWAHRVRFAAADPPPWGSATYDVMADLRAAGWPARPLEETSPL